MKAIGIRKAERLSPQRDIQGNGLLSNEGSQRGPKDGNEIRFDEFYAELNGPGIEDHPLSQLDMTIT